jgi:hypothetical protein
MSSSSWTTVPLIDSPLMLARRLADELHAVDLAGDLVDRSRPRLTVGPSRKSSSRCWLPSVTAASPSTRTACCSNVA